MMKLVKPVDHNEPTNSWEISYFFFRNPRLEEPIDLKDPEILLKVIPYNRRQELDNFIPERGWVKEHRAIY